VSRRDAALSHSSCAIEPLQTGRPYEDNVIPSADVMPIRAVVTAIVLTVACASGAAAQPKVIGVDDDPVLGDAAAPVTIIEFGDYQCPSCRMFWVDVEPRLKRDYIDTGKVKLVFRDFPIVEIHPEAIVAAIAAQCAADQGKYWQYHDKLFREQDRRGEGVIRFKTGDLKKWAADLRLDTAAFNQCLDSARHQDEVAKDYADGAAVGIQGTPMFFVNGRVIGGAQPYPVFKKIIDEELKK
jgi:protein-disulfide isomerase